MNRNAVVKKLHWFLLIPSAVYIEPFASIVSSPSFLGASVLPFSCFIPLRCCSVNVVDLIIQNNGSASGMQLRTVVNG